LKISSKTKKFLIVGAVALLLIVSGYFLYQYASKKFTTDSSGTNGIVADNSGNSSTPDVNNVSTQGETMKSAAPTIEIISPVKGATLADGNSIKIKTNSTTAKVRIVVSSDKWGTVYENTMDAKSEVVFTYAPEQTVPAGSSGNINVKLMDGTTVLAEQTLWVDF